ncbi:hypothetical protein [Anaerotignum sp.]|uniref:hypothetical protein n=1 Tax=Anaerotignum sp. TaxID=2039241 RepID=UPI002A909A2A|nr:hypothetical protein [Anaerotignum sp.]MCI7658167.1 hypothetical protein [Clostridia bacterium]MDY5415201.1 hypothetical protein [Anaerotignum sp.]
MWRKICKEELRETRKVYFVMFAILLAAGILSLVVMRQTVFYPGDTFSGTPEEFDVRSALSIGSIIGMYILWIAAMVFYVVYTLYRFDRGMFGGEGVFWMTLPMKRREILAGKLLAPLVWGIVLVLMGIVWLALGLFVQDPYGSTSFSIEGMAVGIGSLVFVIFSEILMAVGSLYALCFALMAGRLPCFQKHPYLWAAAVALVIFLIIEPLFNVLAMIFIGVPVTFFLVALPFFMTKGIAMFGFAALIPIAMAARILIYGALMVYLAEKKLDYLG